MKKIIITLGSLLLMVAFSACGEKTSGEKLDDAIDQTKEASEGALNDIKKALEN